MPGSLEARFRGAVPTAAANADIPESPSLLFTHRKREAHTSGFLQSAHSPEANITHGSSVMRYSVDLPKYPSQLVLGSGSNSGPQPSSSTTHIPCSDSLPYSTSLTSHTGVHRLSKEDSPRRSGNKRFSRSCTPSSSTSRKSRPSASPPRQVAWAKEIPVPNVDRKETADDSEECTLKRSTKAIRIRELYHWCATVSVLLMLQFIADSLHHRFRYVPQPSEWGVVLLLLYTVASVLSLQCLSGSRPYAAYVLAIGSLLMTCQLTWHWGSHVAQFKDSLLVGQPFSPDMTIHYGNATGYPPSSSPLYGLAFGSSGPDFLDSAACLAVLFLNCVQSSFLCRLGTRITAIVSVLQWVVYACWPFMSADSRSAWLYRIGAMGLWTAHLIRSSYVWESELQQQSARIDKLQQAVAQTLRDLKDGRDADSVLNHVLKNTMADVMGCIDLCRPQAENECLLLSKASNMLFRGMWWCKLREAILELVAGRYETKQEVVDVQEFAQDLVRGREVTLECSSRMVKLDPMACNIVLDNALTNGKRHGYPGDPQVELSVEVVDQTRHEGAPAVPASHTIRIDGWDEHTDPLCVAPDDVRDPNTSCAIPVEVRFTVRNRANPARPLERPWSLEQPSEPLRKDPSRPTLSDGLGLQHISMAARSCGMHARLWQQDAEVHFELCLCTTSAAHAPVVRSAVEPLQKTCPFREGMKILCLDDSGITRQNLEMILTQEIPNATVTMYGKDPADVEEFKRDALAKGDILILDEHVDLPGPELRGSAILQELVAEGYQGFACIRSGDSTDADKVRSYKSGAHWHVGKEVRVRDMVSQLRKEYKKFKGKGMIELHEEP